MKYYKVILDLKNKNADKRSKDFGKLVVKTKLEHERIKHYNNFKHKNNTNRSKIINSRTLYIRAQDTTEALMIARKVKFSKLVNLIQITYEDYEKGVDSKYNHNK